MRLDAVPGLEIALRVNLQDLKEYEDAEGEVAGQDGRNNAAVRYVEAVSGANFSVEFRTDRRFTYRNADLEMSVYLDGVFAEGQVYYARPTHGGHNDKTVSGRADTENGQFLFRRFAFADLETTDGQPKADLKEKLANIGEVTAKIYRVRKTGYANGGKSPGFIEAVGSKGVPEKALKGRAISSRATLGKAIAGRPTKFVTLDYPWGRDPFATFTFKYRSHRDLQIEGIIPRSPSPVPLQERDPDTLTVEEARELVRFQRQQLQDQVMVKKEKRELEEDEQDDDDGVEVTGQGRKRQRTSTDSGIEVIDLSNEDDEDEDED